MPIMNTRTKMYFIASDRARRKNVFHTFFFICAIVFFVYFWRIHLIYITRQRYNSWRICALDRSNIYEIRAQKKRGLFMKYLKQFLIILVISLVGELMNKFIPLPVPASIYGMVILFAGLLTGLIKLDAVKEAGRFLIEIMPVMFIPAGVGLISSWFKADISSDMHNNSCNNIYCYGCKRTRYTVYCKTY